MMGLILYLLVGGFFAVDAYGSGLKNAELAENEMFPVACALYGLLWLPVFVFFALYGLVRTLERFFTWVGGKFHA